MRSFKKFSEDEQDPEMDLDEGALRNLGSIALFSRVESLSRKIKRTNDVSEKLDLLAAQNSTIAAIGLSVGKFLEKSKR